MYKKAILSIFIFNILLYPALAVSAMNEQGCQKALSCIRSIIKGNLTTLGEGQLSGAQIARNVGADMCATLGQVASMIDPAMDEVEFIQDFANFLVANDSDSDPISRLQFSAKYYKPGDNYHDLQNQICSADGIALFVKYTNNHNLQGMALDDQNSSSESALDQAGQAVSQTGTVIVDGVAEAASSTWSWLSDNL